VTGGSAAAGELPEEWVRPDPAVWDEPRMRRALAGRDIGAVYRILTLRGFIQARIGVLTGQSQPEVSAIVNGRKVIAVAVLARIAVGLGIPPGYLGLACCPCPHTTPVPACGGAGDPVAAAGGAGVVAAG
jgi:hypothetical protein